MVLRSNYTIRTKAICGKVVAGQALRKALTMVVVAAAIVGLASAPADAKKAKYKEIKVDNGGTIKGVAKWKGEIPKLPPIRVFKHMDKCGQEVLNPALMVDPNNKGVKHVAVYIKEIAEGKAIPPKKPKLKRDTTYPDGASMILHAGQDTEQRPESLLCNFEEHVWATVRTRRVGMYNLEDLLHNPHAFKSQGYEDGAATLFNFPLPDRNRLVKKKIKRVVGLNRYQCDTHIHMNGWIFGFDHPYFAVTDKTGAYSIKDIPPGKYTVVGWHEGYNLTGFAADNRPIYDEHHVIEQEVEIKGGDTVELNFEFPTREVKINFIKAERTVEGH
ncbi:MAG: hypothetical protein ACE5GQ_01050 [Nitrospinales bacterium]